MRDTRTPFTAILPGLALLCLIFAAGMAEAQFAPPAGQVPNRQVPQQQPPQQQQPRPAFMAGGLQFRVGAGAPQPGAPVAAPKPNPAAAAAAAARRYGPQNQQEAVALENTLQRWERHSAQVSNMSYTFTKFHTDKAFERNNFSQAGMLKYSAPDKGLYQLVGNDQQPEEKWICDGEAVYEFDYEQKQLIERILPEHLRGQAISDGPLPFLFNQSADKLKRRYIMRPVTPPDKVGQVWLEAHPRFASDASNFQQVDIILWEYEGELHLYALRITHPGGQQTDAYVFPEPGNVKPGEERKVNSSNFLNFNFWGQKPRTPFGWKRVVEQPQQPQPDPRNAGVPGNAPR